MKASDQVMTIADHVKGFYLISNLSLTVVVVAVLIALGAFGWMRVKPENKARNSVERLFMLMLLLCSTIAILTTIGIVFSVLFESIRFFQIVPVHDFVLGTQWSPQLSIREDQVGSSGAFGAVPLLSLIHI